MAKAKAKAKAEQTKAEASRAAHRPDPERFNRMVILGIVGAVVVAAIGFIIFGWYETEIRPLGKTVLRVEDTEFDLAHLQRRMQQAVDSGTQLTSANVRNFPDSVLDQLEFEATLLASIGEIDIEVTEDDVDAEIRSIGNLADDVSARAYAEEFDRQVDRSGLTQREYRQMIAAQIAAERALNYFSFLAPADEPQVRWRWIIAETEEDAQAAADRLDAGEEYDLVANEFSVEGTRPEDLPEGAERDTEWALRGSFPDKRIETFLFDSAEVGDRSSVIGTDTFFYVVELLEREEARPLEEAQRRFVGNRDLSAWLEDRDLDIERNLSEGDAVRVLNDLDPRS